MKLPVVGRKSKGKTTKKGQLKAQEEKHKRARCGRHQGQSFRTVWVSKRLPRGGWYPRSLGGPGSPGCLRRARIPALLCHTL